MHATMRVHLTFSTACSSQMVEELYTIISINLNLEKMNVQPDKPYHGLGLYRGIL